MDDKIAAKIDGDVDDPTIKDIVEGRSKYSSQDGAQQAIARLKTKLKMSTIEQDSGVPTVWVKGFALSKEELDQGFIGNFAEVFIIEDGNEFMVRLRKLEVPLANHPQKRPPPHGGDCPNWGHPLLRRLLKGPVYFDNVDMAYSALNGLENKYESSQRPSDGTLRILVYSRPMKDGRPTGKPAFDQATLRVGFGQNNRPYIFCESKGYHVTHKTEPVVREVDSAILQPLSHFVFRSDSQLCIDATKVLYEIYALREGRSDFKMQTGINAGRIDNDPCVYHYTTQAGLDGILKKGKIWLTDLRFMNDRSEMRHGFEFAYDAMKIAMQEKVDKAVLVNSPDDVIAKIKFDLLNAYRRLEAGDLHRQLFSTCFSMDAQQAGAWQNYASNGSGYAIGFRHKYLRKLKNPSDFQYRRVYYHKDRKDSIIKEFIAGSLDSIMAFYTGSANHNDGLRFWMDILYFFGSTFKHSSWYHEKEWRLMRSYRPTNDPRLAIEGRMKLISGLAEPSPIPYIELDLQGIFDCTLQELIKEVIVGPVQAPSIRSNAVSLLLSQNSLFDVVVKTSDVPLSGY